MSPPHKSLHFFITNLSWRCLHILLCPGQLSIHFSRNPTCDDLPLLQAGVKNIVNEVIISSMKLIYSLTLLVRNSFNATWHTKNKNYLRFLLFLNTEMVDLWPWPIPIYSARSISLFAHDNVMNQVISSHAVALVNLEWSCFSTRRFNSLMPSDAYMHQ